MKHTRMKNRRFFYGIIVIFAVVGILACFEALESRLPLRVAR